MTDNTFNLDELNELKQAYQLIDEKLDGKEIVTPEQIRTVTLNNIGFFKRVFKRDFSWTYLAFIPVLILVFAIEHVLTAKAICVLGIYLAVEFILRFWLIRKMNRVDHSTLDLKTMLEEENSYMKASIAMACFGYIFWGAFNYIFINSTFAIFFLAIVFIMLLSKTNFLKKRVSIRTIAAPVQPSEPGKFRRVFLWITSTFLAVVVIFMLTGVGYNVFNGNINLIELCDKAGMIIVSIAIVLQGFFLKKIRLGEAPKLAKVTSILVIIAMVLSLISVANLFITKSSVEYLNVFPLLIGVLILYTNNVTKK